MIQSSFVGVIHLMSVFFRAFFVMVSTILWALEGSKKCEKVGLTKNHEFLIFFKTRPQMRTFEKNHLFLYLMGARGSKKGPKKVKVKG